MRDNVEWFKWDCEDSFTSSTYWGSVPSLELDKGDIKIYYCYYESSLLEEDGDNEGDQYDPRTV